jgi:hypothetical protein
MRDPAMRSQQGQVLVLFLGFAAALIGIMLVSFNSGQVTNAKMRAMNAADSAAYSGAVWQARSLNFQAYMNRAMVVNEVTIAQSVSLRSWVDYLNRFVRNVNLVTEFIPYVGEVTIAIARVLDRVDDVMQKTMPSLEIGSRALTYLEHDLQKGFNIVGSIGATEIAVDVAKKNGAEISRGGYALFATNAVEWTQFTETYTGNGRKRLRAVTLDSRDGFTQDRSWVLNFFLGKVDKQGGADLVNYDAWKAMDSAAICTGVIKCRPWVEVGWGGAQAYAPNRTNAIGIHGNGSDWNRNDGRRARAEANAVGKSTKLSTAFPGYRDLHNLNAASNDKQKITFAVEVMVADKNVSTANRAFGSKAALTDGTKIEYDPQFSGEASGVYGLAEACVAFERPIGGKRSDGRVERPSLFNPYWRASLVTPSRYTRVEVGAVKGLPPVEAFLGGAGSCN